MVLELNQEVFMLIKMFIGKLLFREINLMNCNVMVKFLFIKV